MLPQCRRSKLKGSVAKRSRSNVKKAETLIWLDFVLMMRKLAAAAAENAKEGRQSTITKENIRAVEEEILASCQL